MQKAALVALTLLILAVACGASGVCLLFGAGWTLLFLAAAFLAFAGLIARGMTTRG